MAVVWAKSNGNWTDTTLWAFWNEVTQQIEDYGQEPQLGDTVYANGFTVSYNMATVNNTLRNDTNPYTGNSNGSFSYPYASITINGDCYIGDAGLFSGSYTLPINYNGNIIKIGAGGISIRNQSTININGNVIIEEGATGILFYKNEGGGQHAFVINGNLEINAGTFGEVLSTTTINGNCIIKGTLCQSTNIGTKSISGRCDIYTQQNSFALRVENLLNIYNITQTFTSLQINKIHYYGAGYNLGINVASIGIIDVTQFEAKRIYDTPDYPAESNVKKDIPYDYGQMVGTYDLENLLPPESVVLKDYEYGDSDDRKTGTMPVLSQQLISRLENCATVETVQQLLVAHLDN